MLNEIEVQEPVAGSGAAEDRAGREGTQMTEHTGGQRFVREVNDSIYEVLFKFVSEDGEFWCECEDTHCEQRITLTLREYAALRKRPDAELLSRTHEQNATTAE